MRKAKGWLFSQKSDRKLRGLGKILTFVVKRKYKRNKYNMEKGMKWMAAVVLFLAFWGTKSDKAAIKMAKSSSFS